MSAALPISRAFATASRRGLFPTDLGSAALSRLGNGLWQQVFFSARVSNVQLLTKLKELVDRYTRGGYQSDKSQLKLEARRVLAEIGYEPHPDDAGGLKDLSSDRRLDLILETNRELARGLTQRELGRTEGALVQFPFWELVRVAPRKVPRGSVNSGSIGWEARWLKAGGQLTEIGGQLRMIALKTDPIWAKLGDKALFEDALNVDHPPFAFWSGMGWRATAEKELLGAAVPDGKRQDQKIQDQKRQDQPLESPNLGSSNLPKTLGPMEKEKILAALKTMKGKPIDFAALARLRTGNERDVQAAVLLALVMRGGLA